MTATERDHLEAELADAERSLANVTDPKRQVPPTEEGLAYRVRLQADIARLRLRLAELSEDEE